MKMWKKVISTVTAVMMTASMVVIPSAMATESSTINYTFDSVEKTQMTLGDGKTYDLDCYDGQPDSFVYAEEGKSWKSGWFSYDKERNGVSAEIPTSKEMYIDGGLLHVNLADYNTIKLRLPVAKTGTYKVSFTMTKTGGAAEYVRMNINSTPSNSDGDANPTGTGAMTADYRNSISQTYSKVFQFDKTDGNYISIVPVQKGFNFTIDEMSISEFNATEVTKIVPADGLKNVNTYVEPFITFDSAIDPATISNIKLMAGDTVIEAIPTMASTGNSVELKTSNQLPANTEIKIVIPDTVKNTSGTSVLATTSTFTTGKANVIYSADFEREGNQGDHGIMYGYGAWPGFNDNRPLQFAESKINTGNALKARFDTKWQNIDFILSRLNGVGGSANSKIENKSATYIVSFDTYLEGTSGKVRITFKGGNSETIIGDYSASTTPAVTHVEKIVESTSTWNPKLEIKDLFGNVTVDFNLYIDNLVVTEIVANNTPQIISSIPANEEKNVKTTTDITVKFDQEVNIDGGVALYETETEEEVAVTASLDSSKKTLTIHPTSVLKINTDYIVDLSSVQGVSGAVIEEEPWLTFTTGDVELTGTEILFYDFEREYAEGDNGVEYGISSKWNVELSRNSVDPKNGQYAYSMKTTGTGGNVKFKIPSTMAVDNYRGKKYEFTMDVKLASGTVTKDTELYLSYWTSVENNISLGSFKPSDEYVTIKTKLIVPETAQVWSPVIYVLHPEAGVELLLDNVTLREIDEPYAKIQYNNAGQIVIMNNRKMETAYKGQKIDVTFHNFGSATGNYKGFVAVYDKTGTLVNASVADVNVANGVVDAQALSTTLPTVDDITSYSIEAFLWDEMAPVINPTQVIKRN